VELYKKPKSRFFFYDFTIGNKRYRGSTKETNRTRAAAIAALKLSQVTEGHDPLPKKAVSLIEFSSRFLEWVKTASLEHKTQTYYRTGWKLISVTPIAGMRLDKITKDEIEALRFPGSASNSNCALRTLRRMLHKAEEWKMLSKAPKFKLVKEYGRSATLDEETEKKLLAAAINCHWRKGSLQLFRDIVMLVRETGLRNERELYRMRIENLDWENKLIFVPDSKTEGGRRKVPMSDRAFEILQRRCGNRKEGWLFASKRARSGHLTTIGKQFRMARQKQVFPIILCSIVLVTISAPACFNKQAILRQ
jgi:integrase